MNSGKTEIFTVTDAAEFLGYTVQHVRLLLRAGRLAGRKLGREWIVVRSDLEGYSARRFSGQLFMRAGRGTNLMPHRTLQVREQLGLMHSTAGPSATTRREAIYSSENAVLYQVDCFDWLRERESDSIHAVVTDPPYGFIEYQESHLEKMKNGRGGVWRIPPSLNGYIRSPLPRFTVQSPAELSLMKSFFAQWATLAFRVLVPGGHVFIATNPLLSDFLCGALRGAGFEKRGEFIRLVTTLRGGDRPKGAEHEFPGVTVMPRSHFEPWVVFRKPCDGRVADNLRMWKTGGLRRISDKQPFGDMFRCPPASQHERRLAQGFPTLKPQALMRHLVRASLPLGEGIVLDTFAGSGSTLAAAEAVGYHAVGLEKNKEYALLAASAIPKLARLKATASHSR